MCIYIYICIVFFAEIVPFDSYIPSMICSIQVPDPDLRPDRHLCARGPRRLRCHCRNGAEPGMGGHQWVPGLRCSLWL